MVNVRFKTRAERFENDEWEVIDGTVYRAFRKPPTNKMISNAIERILKDLHTMIPDYQRYEVEVDRQGIFPL